MPIASQLIYNDQPNAMADTYVVPPGADIVLDSVVASVTGAGASATFIPTLEILSQDNKVMARVRTDQEFAIGDTGVVTWAPFC